MESGTGTGTVPATTEVAQKHVYSVWAVPPEDVADRLKKLMDGLRSEFGGPQFQPHVTVVGAIRLTEQDALEKFRSACDGLKAYTATVDRVATGIFFYQCVYLLLHPTPEVVEASEHCIGHFGYKRSTRKFYRIHLFSLFIYNFFLSLLLKSICEFTQIRIYSLARGDMLSFF
uniref:Cyclic phosphodiesterase n=1 Tax=Manihot esculenta TaxID=3983 RepID=A0A2C9U6G2_MANES